MNIEGIGKNFMLLLSRTSAIVFTIAISSIVWRQGLLAENPAWGKDEPQVFAQFGTQITRETVIPVRLFGKNLDKLAAVAWRIDRIFVPPRRLRPDVLNRLDPSHWQEFSPEFTLNLGDGDGERNVWFGIKSISGQERWQRYRIFVDNVSPRARVLTPSHGRVVQPMIQITAESDEDLASVEFAVNNEAGAKPFEAASITDRAFDIALQKVAKTTFQCPDVALADGLNVVTFRLTDRAGNVGTDEARFVLDLASDHDAPQLIVHWPTETDEVYSKIFRIRGRVDDPTAKIEVKGENGKTWTALVERNGLFWIHGLPLHQRTSHFSITATDPAGNTSQQDLVITKSDVELTVNELPHTETSKRKIFVTGTTSHPEYPVWVNGVRATVSGNTWSASDVPVNKESGSLIIQPIAALDSEVEPGTGGNAPTLENMGNPRKKRPQPLRK